MRGIGKLRGSGGVEVGRDVLAVRGAEREVQKVMRKEVGKHNLAGIRAVGALLVADSSGSKGKMHQLSVRAAKDPDA